MNKPDNNKSEISIIGLGAMGTALARAMLKSHMRTTVWNRSPEKAKALIREGALHATQIEEAIANSPLSVICLSDYQSVREILFPLNGCVGGKVIVNLTNGTPDQAKEISNWVLAHSAEYLDGGIMAIPPMIGTPEALIFYSGSDSAFKQWRSVLANLGTPRYLNGDVGLASLYDISLLIAMYGMFGGFLQAAALAHARGVKVVELADAVIPWLKAMTQPLATNATQIDTRHYEMGVVSNLGMQSIAYNNLIEVCKTAGLSVELMYPLKVMFDEAVAKGYGKSDISVLVESINKTRLTGQPTSESKF